MKKKTLYILIPIILILIIILLIFLLTRKKEEKFYINSYYYKVADIKEITKEELQKHESNKENFLLFVYQPMCFASDKFNIVLYDFAKKYNIGFLKIPFSEITETEANKCIKYYPTISVYKKGKIVAFLEADNNDDIEHYIYLKKEV